MKTIFLLNLFLVLIGGASTAATTYTSLPYRGKADSPFYSSILRGETFVEDFEDRILDPRLTLPIGRISTTGRNSVDEDDGLLDNLGVGFHWQVSGALIPGETMFSIEIKFERDSGGRFPSHAGLAFLGFSPSDLGEKRFFQAYDSAGVPIPNTLLSASVPVYSGISSSVSTVGDRFFGVSFDNGISKIMVLDFRIDHIQFGYGVIPEPGTAALALWSVWQLAGRRRRTPPSP